MSLFLRSARTFPNGHIVIYARITIVKVITVIVSFCYFFVQITLSLLI